MSLPQVTHEVLSPQDRAIRQAVFLFLFPFSCYKRIRLFTQLQKQVPELKHIKKALICNSSRIRGRKKNNQQKKERGATLEIWHPGFTISLDIFLPCLMGSFLLEACLELRFIVPKDHIHSCTWRKHMKCSDCFRWTTFMSLYHTKQKEKRKGRGKVRSTTQLTQYRRWGLSVQCPDLSHCSCTYFLPVITTQ